MEEDTSKPTIIITAKAKNKSMALSLASKICFSWR